MLKTRKAIVILLFALGLSACKGEGPDAGQLASKAAKEYYDMLLKGHYKDFVAGYYCPDSIPQSYRLQLELNAQMFVEQQQKEHGGIKQVEVIQAKADTARHEANVFMSVTFADRVTEQINVPMVERKGEWKMR